MSDLLAKTKHEGQTGRQQSKSSVCSMTWRTLCDARRLEEEFSDVVIPTLADVLLTYANPEINDQIQLRLQRLRDTKDIAGFRKRAFMTAEQPRAQAA